MFEIKAAREIRGTVDVPPSFDLLALTTAVALTSRAGVTVGPIPASTLATQWKSLLDGHLAVTESQDHWQCSPVDRPQPRIIFADSIVPHRDFMVFLLLGLGKTVVFGKVSQRRIDVWENALRTLGQTLTVTREDTTVCLALSDSADMVVADEPLSPDDLCPILGLALGRGCRVSVRTSAPFSDPLRHCLVAFGYSISVKGTVQTEDDPIKKRLRFLQKARKAEEPPSFTVSADFSQRPADEKSISLPGDEILTTLLICAKSLIQKGNLIIRNASLEAWACHMLDFVRKMGCRPGIQAGEECSFGATGLIQLQNFGLTNRKAVCRPMHQFAAHVPAMVITACFSPGQSVFRGLEDVRNDEPDGIARIVSGLGRLGVRHGEMPDGIIIEGARQFDGFDQQEPFGAPIDGAFAIAGLKCIGTTTIPGEQIVRRWPAFRDMLDAICDFK